MKKKKTQEKDEFLILKFESEKEKFTFRNIKVRKECLEEKLEIV